MLINELIYPEPLRRECNVIFIYPYGPYLYSDGRSHSLSIESLALSKGRALFSVIYIAHYELSEVSVNHVTTKHFGLQLSGLSYNVGLYVPEKEIISDKKSALLDRTLHSLTRTRQLDP